MRSEHHLTGTDVRRGVLIFHPYLYYKIRAIRVIRVQKNIKNIKSNHVEKSVSSVKSC